MSSVRSRTSRSSTSLGRLRRQSISPNAIVVPTLQEAGVASTEHTGRTFRDHLAQTEQG